MGNKHKVEISLTLEGDDAMELLRALGSLGRRTKAERRKVLKPKKGKSNKTKKSSKAKKPSKTEKSSKTKSSRPRGRPPKGKVWSESKGKYIIPKKYTRSDK